MCYASSKDFGWGARKETKRRPEAETETPAETPEKPAKEQEFTFWAFPSWHRTSASSTPSGERSRERV
ncbi:hypothetical protein [Arthrobacter sp. Soil764]|jgi:hypothetical protein|uniref:hypothetical protein n=1 Tax=Arthrobacter sp. Soil764 TaxID=1736403 RepID=UPI0006F64754|nr:hypothetical protein [Arthrobacter sp. Soil764]KRE91266.1 hypothetical protein ASG86_16020 [Arthrobacter sp. Soil764]TQJ39213.1 hypothetical protein FBY33_1227 [Arthrobacter sp. SLBN-112]